MPIDIRLQQLFKQYQNAFINYELDNVSRCYHLPCTLNTPDKIVLLSNEIDCQKEFSAIFTQLRQANTRDITVQKASFSEVSKQLYLVCIEWDFIDEKGSTFADFAAIYHVLDTGEALKIINVVSHELESSLTLAKPLHW